ncbi:MAG: apolipoprotein A1/A4/E family protein [Prevotellaceae bacterium]|jgi:hypothetical protein|nr:apolipoprotein A1/A4/E family protein [Prevotellaceae bacterium]
MKTKLFILAVCLTAIFYPAFGQKVKSDYLKMSVSLPVVDETYSKDKRFKVIIPDEISILAKNVNKEVAGGFFGELRMLCPVPAKSVNEKKGETPDIIFEIVSPGIQNLRIGWAYYAKIAEKKESIDKITPASTGYIADITFNFPLKLEVKDGNGNIKRTITFADETEEFHAVYHNNFFKEKAVGDKSLEFPPVAFPTKHDLDTSIFIFGESAVTLRTAKNKLENLFSACMKTIRMCYGDNSYMNKRYDFHIYKLTEWDDPANTKLSEAVEQLKTAFTPVYDSNSQQTLAQKLPAAIAVFEEYLTEYGEKLSPIRKLCLHNLALAYYFSGDYKNASKHYQSYYKEFGSTGYYLSDPPAPDIYTYYQLKKSPSLHYPDNFISGIENKVNEQKQEEKAKIAYKKQEQADSIFRERNPYGKGTVFDANDNEISAIVSILLMGRRQESGIVDIGPETPVKLYCLADSSFHQSFRIKEVKKIIVNNSVYIPVTTGSGLLSSTNLMKLVYEKGNFQLFYDVRWSNYCIRLIEQDKTCYVNDILKAKKSAAEFYKSCPALKDQQLMPEDVADENDTAGILKSMKGIVDQLESICK